MRIELWIGVSHERDYIETSYHVIGKQHGINPNPLDTFKSKERYLSGTGNKLICKGIVDNLMKLNACIPPTDLNAIDLAIKTLKKAVRDFSHNFKIVMNFMER